MFRGCIFDLDGTLTDTLESIACSVNKALQEMNLPEITLEQCRGFVGNGARYLMEKALDAKVGNTDRIEEAMEIFRRTYHDNCTYRVTTYEGIPELLANLKEKGVKMAVLSNKPHPQAIDVVETIFGKDMFSWIQGQCDEIARKPAPDGVYYVAQKMGLEPQECLYVGDSEVDIATGKAAHVSTVGVTWGFRTREVLEEAGAEHIINRPEELSEIF